MKRTFSFVLLTFCILFSLHCSINKELPVAQVGSEKLMPDDINLEAYQHLTDSTRYHVLLNFVNNWVDLELLYQEAKREKFTLTPAMESELQRVRKAMVVNQFVNDRINQLVSVSGREVQEYYDQHEEEYVAETDYFMFLGLKITGGTVENEIETEIGNNTNIIDIYEKYPEHCQLVSLGNGLLSEMTINRSLIDALKNQIGKTGFGKATVNGETHFLKLLEHVQKGQTKPLQTVKNDIHNILLIAKKEDTYNDRIGSLRSNQDINHEINTDIIMILSNLKNS